MPWRYWLIDMPNSVLDVVMACAAVYFRVVIALSAITVPVMVLVLLVLWFGFGIRWGW